MPGLHKKAPRTIQIARPFIDSKDIAGVVKVLKSGNLSLGTQYQLFEKELATYVGASYGCAVSSGTSGLHLAVKAVGLSAGDEVITSPFSFVASSNCLLYEGVTPVFVDIDPVTFNMDPAKIEAAITKKTKAILVVHIFGQSAEMKPILKLAKKYKLSVIEDACESLGSTYYGKPTGSMGDIGVFAFYPNKQMTTGEGGMIVTSKKKYYELCSSLRNQGRSTNGDWLIHERVGYNYRMDEMSASLGITQLKKLDHMIAQKRKLVSQYQRALHTIPGIVLPQIGENRTHSWFVYVIRIQDGKRNKVMKHLADHGIQTKPYLPVIHLQPFMQSLFGYKAGSFPVAEQVASETLALPFYIGLTATDIKYIAQTIASCH